MQSITTLDVMSKELWTTVDHYMVERLIPRDPVLDEALQANASAGLTTIDVAPNQGKLLQLLARIQVGFRILDLHGALAARVRKLEQATAEIDELKFRIPL